MPTPTLQSLQQDTLSRLNEAVNSPAGSLATGTGGTTIATDDTITAYLNEAAADICRTCWPLPATATVTPASGQSYIPLVSLAPIGYNTLWAARDVVYGATALQRVSRAYADLLYPTYATDSGAVPAYWYPVGAQGIGLAPKAPADASVVTVDGLALPTALAESGDTVTWIDADLARLMSYYAAYWIAVKNFEDASLSARIQALKSEYDAGRQAIWTRGMQADKATMQAFYPMAPLPGK